MGNGIGQNVDATCKKKMVIELKIAIRFYTSDIIHKADKHC